MLSLSGEVFVYKKLCTLSAGTFCVPIAPQQIQHFLQKQIQPPLVESVQAPESVPAVKREMGDLYRVGFPVLKEERNACIPVPPES